MSSYSIILYGFILIALISAIGILAVNNVFKAALFLLTCLLSLAAIYVLCLAEFVAVTQILVYAGGVVVVIIFGIMLTTKLTGKPLEVKNGNLFPGLLAALAFASMLVKYQSMMATSTAELSTMSENLVSKTGVELMTNYVLPFELAGLLLLMALIGAAVTTRSTPE
ncbi:NADH-quinone oxidoreductase subunit J family protein [Chryseosolibacter indicus]|uniref:NADH-quinone oxidoreductase subunit J n=1 Tax=Chryseosolibacter indicus TaxID=2782351 RepID=A0ABS5VMP7_9BACT|nr:NADH-quinone oxidoreductase subunit J [Chryseosolibacter indicus]MBT1702723.1 NADH-quinone oxidoreductase subunit J [Chryseosolibacter indicus]